MKNFQFVKTKGSYALLSPDGNPEVGFSMWVKTLKYKPNTLGVYCRAVAAFLDYIQEGALQNEEGLTSLLLMELCESYEEYLIYGSKSGDNLAKEISKTLPSPLNKVTSLDNKFPAIIDFLGKSEALLEKLKELSELGLLDDILLDPNNLVIKEKFKATSISERAAINHKSWLSGCMAGGAKVLRARVLIRTIKKPDDDYINALWQTESGYKSKAFPYDKVLDLIEATPKYRDKAILALLAATGCRKSEALQILWDDIDIKNREVILIDPALRPDIYRTLSSQEREKLSWKARDTPKTFILGIFGTQFFKYLELYYEYEYVKSANHEFIFQSLEEKVYGKPYFTAGQDSFIDIFKKAAFRVHGENNYTPHSLRHTYGYYLKNWALRSDGKRGLDLATVKQYMGHKSVKSTERYALNDRFKELLELSIINTDYNSMQPNKSIDDIKIEHLEEQIKMLEKRKNMIILEKEDS